MEESSIQVEKISQLEAAQKKARLDLAVKGLKSKMQVRNPAKLSPTKKPSVRIPKRKMADSLDASSARASDEEEEEVLDEIITDGARKLLLSPIRKAVSSPKKRKTASTGPRISDIFPDPASWPYKLTKEAVDQMSLKEFLKAKELALQEKQHKATEKDIPGTFMETTVLTLPPIEAVGGPHDYLKILCPASLIHMPLGDPVDWWPLVPVEWPLVTGMKSGF